MITKGKFVISLDFELMWGMRDKKTIKQYGENIIGVHAVIPRLLEMFTVFDIEATFSTVGFLFFKSKTELLNNIPLKKPHYNDSNLSPYEEYFDKIGEHCKEDLYHYAPTLIELIKSYPNQEIGTHTFSHYYCLEEGQTIDTFKQDLVYAKKVADKIDIQISSLVFPRNQFNEEYLNICNELGIICYRGNEHSWLYKAKNGEKESLFRRACRLIDAYINITGHNCYSNEFINSTTPLNVPASRFLRPYSKRLQILDLLKLERIKSGMSHAAKHNLTYHLWWHPHNFGINQEENFLFLKKILLHFKLLQNKYGYQSLTMTNLAKQIRNEQ